MEHEWRPVVESPVALANRLVTHRDNGRAVRIGADDHPRLTVVEQTHYQSPNRNPESTVLTYQRWLVSTAQPWARRLTVGTDWMPLGKGCWLTTGGEWHGALALRNDEDVYKGRQTIPTPEERAEVEARILVVALKVGDAVVPLFSVRPGESARIPNPSQALLCDTLETVLVVRCLAGSAEFSLYIYPS